MLEGNLCELCKRKVQPTKARHKQTKYCVACAKIKKRQNTEDPWPPEKRRDYMRAYMRCYRAQTRLNCLTLSLLFLGMDGRWLKSLNFTFEEINNVLGHVELLVMKVTGLALVAVLCIRHLKHAWREKDEEKK